MRIRSTKPDFWRSKTIAAQDWDARLVLKGLESYVDDNGVGKDSVVLICADVFPHDLASDSGTLARVSGALCRLAEANLVARYVIAGESLIYVRRWKEIQRVDKPNKGRYPRPDGSMEYSDDVDESIGAGHGIADAISGQAIPETVANPRDTLANPRETVAPGTGEQGNRGTGEQDDDGWPTEPPFDPDAAPRDVVVEPTDAPASVQADTKPRKRHPSAAAMTVVRQVLGNAGYPRSTVERLAVQVENLAREGHPDSRIRQALAEWDRRPDCSKPEFLPTVLGDVVKQTRAAAAPPRQAPASRKVAAGLDLAARLAGGSTDNQPALEA